jgi:hypothetical protein
MVRREYIAARIGAMQLGHAELADGALVDHDALRCMMMRMYDPSLVHDVMDARPGERRITSMAPELVNYGIGELRAGLRATMAEGVDLDEITCLMLEIQRWIAVAYRLAGEQKKKYTLGIEVRG